MTDRPVGYCTGKDCRRSDGFAELSELMNEHQARRLSCVDICHGPVVVVGGERPLVLSRLRKPKQIRDLRHLLAEGELSERLAKRREGGSRAKKARRKLG